jgi:hypothetical protein
VIAAIATAIQAQFDADPATIPDWALVGGLLASGLGLLLARDNDKTSEQVGARRR